jgi:N-acyl-D-amino-acid deacylase
MFADYIGRHVRKNGILTLEEAIKKATSLPAQRFGLRNRGIIKPDYFADIVIFDYDKINIKGDFKHPRQAPDGIHYVIVNGQITFEEKEHTKKKAGKVLRHEI